METNWVLLGLACFCDLNTVYRTIQLICNRIVPNRKCLMTKRDLWSWGRANKHHSQFLIKQGLNLLSNTCLSKLKPAKSQPSNRHESLPWEKFARMSNSRTKSIKVPMKWKTIAAYLNVLKKYSRMAFSFLALFSF